jgi:hypothetical protein
MAIKKNTEIKVQVGLDENNIPEQMKWSASFANISSLGFSFFLRRSCFFAP